MGSAFFAIKISQAALMTPLVASWKSCGDNQSCSQEVFGVVMGNSA